MFYDNLSDVDKKAIIKKLYIDEQKSFADIAGLYKTYSNKIRRDAIRFKIAIRSKSEAQKNALDTGKICHPTKGKKRSPDIKQKIGHSVLKSWEALSEQEIQARKDKAKNQWACMTEEQKQNMLDMANQAVRQSSKTGSKLEKYLLDRLLSDGYKVDFHKEQVLSNTKLQIDLFLPSINTAIEVDGPSHFLPVWGSDALTKNKKYDNKKHGLIIGKGWKLIRIKQEKEFSKSRADLVYVRLKQVLQESNNSNTTSFIIEDN